MVELKVRIKRERLLEQILTLASTWLKVLIFLDTYVIKIYHYHLHLCNVIIAIISIIVTMILKKVPGGEQCRREL